MSIETNTMPDWMRERLVESGTEDGVQWVTARAPHGGAINGYVRIPEGNPWSGRDYNRIYGVKVHGGLTFSEGDWIGFDTLHSGDVWPGSEYNYGGTPWDVNWTPERVVTEVTYLARQIASAPETERAPVYPDAVSSARDAALAEWDEKKGYADRDDFLAGFEAGFTAAALRMNTPEGPEHD